MNLKRAIRWGLRYRTISFASFALGATIAGTGAYIAAPDVLQGEADPTSLLEPSILPLFLPFLVLGLAVWMTGSSMALFHTVPRAVSTEAADQFDTEHMKSDILSVLDDRLRTMHTEVEQTRRTVERLGGAQTGTGQSGGGQPGNDPSGPVDHGTQQSGSMPDDRGP